MKPKKTHQILNNIISITLMLIGWKTIQIVFGIKEFIVWGANLDPMNNQQLYLLIVFTTLTMIIIYFLTTIFTKTFILNLKYSTWIMKEKKNGNE